MRKSWYLGINKTIYCIPIEIRKELFDLIGWEAVLTMLLLTNCEVHTGKYLDRSFEVWAPCINYMQYPWGYALRLWVISSVPVSHILSTREGMQYPWVISSVPVSHILSTREDMQYPWVISSVPVRICSTRKSYHQCPWVISSVSMTVCSTCEDMQYPWGKFHSFFIHINLLTGTKDMTHGYWWYDSRVLHILTGTEDMTHGYCISSGVWGYDSWVLHILTGTEDMTHGCWGYDSRVLRIWLTGNAYPHGYWGYDSQVLMIWFTGNAYPHGYCISSRVLHIVYTGWWGPYEKLRFKYLNVFPYGPN